MCSNDDIVTMLCRRIRMARIENNWSQIELAERTNLGIATIKRIEMGGAITLLTLIAVLRGLGELDQLKNILVHKEQLFNAKRQKLHQRKRRLLNKESTMTIMANPSNYGFILADDSSTMRWQKK